MRKHPLRVLYVTALVIVLLDGVVFSARWSIEDPTAFPGVWYRISLGTAGELITGDGDGSGWHYYPASDTYRMWFRNGSYDPARKGRLEYQVYVEAVDVDRATNVAIRYVWTTPAWSQTGHSGPPTPSEVPTLGDESDAMVTHSLMTVDYRMGLGSKEAGTSYTIEAYNPEWTGIEIAGYNAYIFRGAAHECLPKDTPDDGDDDTDSPTVCCRRST